MNTGQTLLVALGLLIFTVFILTVYRTTASRFAMVISNEALLTGSALAQSMVDQIIQKGFDEKTIDKVVLHPDSLTAPSRLGPDLFETDVTKFDDIDDYNNYTQNDSLPRLGRFKTFVLVNYVSQTNPDQISTIRTFFKKISVYVINDLVKDTVKIYRIVTY